MAQRRVRTLSGLEATGKGFGESGVIKLPRDFPIQTIILKVYGTIDTDASNDPSPLAEDVARLLSRIKLVAKGAGGSELMVDLRGKDLFYLNMWDYGRDFRTKKFPTTKNKTDQAIEMWYVLPFQVNPRNRFESLACINAPVLNALELEFTVGAQTDFDANGYLKNLNLNVLPAIVEFVPKPDEKYSILSKIKYLHEVTAYSASGTHTYDVDVFAGVIDRLFYIVRDSNDKDLSASLTSYTVELGGSFLFEPLTRADMATIIDAIEQLHPWTSTVSTYEGKIFDLELSIPTTGLTKGDLKVKETVSGACSITRIYKIVETMAQG